MKTSYRSDERTGSTRLRGLRAQLGAALTDRRDGFDGNPHYATVIGAELNRDNLTAVITDLNADVLGMASTAPEALTPSGVAKALKLLVPRLFKRARLKAPRVAGAALALTGLVDRTQGICRQSTLLGWRDVAIGQALSRSLNLPVIIENDANAVAIGELHKGEARHVRDLVVLSIGHGIGAGIIVGGEIHRGSLGAAGELGHCTVELDGRRCRCGKRGCLEATASMPAVIKQARERGISVTGLDELELLAAHGNQDAIEILERAARAVGVALSHVVNVLDPQLLIVAGSGIKLGAAFRGRIGTHLKLHALPLLPRLPKLVILEEQPDVWARGAASVAAQAFFNEGRWDELAERHNHAHAATNRV